MLSSPQYPTAYGVYASQEACLAIGNAILSNYTAGVDDTTYPAPTMAGTTGQASTCDTRADVTRPTSRIPGVVENPQDCPYASSRTCAVAA